MTGNLKTLSSRAIRGEFYKRLEETQQRTWSPLITSEFRSDQEIEIYKFLGVVAALEEVKSDYKKTTLRASGLQVLNKKWGRILEIDEDDMRRDKTDQIMVRVRNLAGRAAQVPAQQISRLINTNGNAWDGVAFFHASAHVNPQGTAIANAISYNAASTTALTGDEGVAATLKGIQQILGFVDDVDEPANEFAEAFMVMCPTNLFDGLSAAIKNDFINNGVSNTLRTSGFNITLRNNPRLTDTSKFFVFRADADVKAFIWQDEVDPTFDERTPGNSDAGFEKDKYMFKAKRIGNAAYGRFDQAVQITLT